MLGMASTGFSPSMPSGAGQSLPQHLQLGQGASPFASGYPVGGRPMTHAEHALLQQGMVHSRRPARQDCTGPSGVPSAGPSSWAGPPMMAPGLNPYAPLPTGASAFDGRMAGTPVQVCRVCRAGPICRSQGQAIYGCQWLRLVEA